MAQDPPFGRLVRERRRALDLTQDELARRVGCAPVTLRKIEYGDLRPSAQIAERLAMALAVPLDERPDFIRQARAVRREPPAQRDQPPSPPPGAPALSLADLSGRAIRGYQLGAQLGSGGFGAVYVAVQPLIEREVAIKIILPQYADQPTFIRRFEAEAQLVARLEHPHIVPLYDYWREPGLAVLVMRYLRGGSLHARLQQGPPSLTQTLQLIEQISAALAAAHRAGVVHRDVKPANILLDPEGNAYLADFGIATDARRPADLSFAGAFVGSPAYSSPEQLRAEPVTPQTDIYALGVLLYELLAGQRPFAGPTPALLAQQHLSAPVPALAALRPDLPPALDQIVQRALAKVPSARYGDVRELAAALRVVAAPESAAVVPTRAAQAAPPTVMLDLDAADNPYPGLRPFAEADAAGFFGREALIQQLLTRLGETDDLARFLAVIGPSGSGKSSAVQAGLIPALRRGGLPGSDQWFIVDLRPGSEPLAALAEALRRVAPAGVETTDLEALLGADSRGLLRAARLVLPADPAGELLLVIDQFEELFTLCEDEGARAHLLDSLVTAIIDERSRLRVVITLRADLLDRPLQYVDFGELLRQRAELVLALTPDETERAIVGPARQLGLTLEDGLTAALVADLDGQPGGLPLLQHALSEIFVRRQGRLLTRAAYYAIGGVAGALAQTAEAIYAGLDAPSQALARQVLLRLTTPDEGSDDTRRRVRRSELLTLGGSAAQVLAAFGAGRLLTFDHDPATREPTVEVAHEALLRAWPRLREWLAASRADLLLQRRLATAAREWLQAQRDPSFLATGARLSQFAALAAAGDVALNDEENAYLQQSLAAREAQAAIEDARQERELTLQQRAARRLRYLVGALAIFLVAALGLSAFAFNRQAAADANAARAAANLTRSEAQRLAAEASSLYQSGSSADVVGLLSVRAIQTEYTPQGDAALAAAATLDYPRQQFIGHTQLVDKVAFSPDGRYVLTGSGDQTARLWDAQTGQELRQFVGHTDIVNSVAFSPDGTLILTVSADGTARLWSAQTGQELRQFVGHTGSVDDAVFSPAGATIFTGSMTDRTARRWDVRTGQELRRFTGHTDGIDVLAVSPDGSLLLTGSFDQTARLWDTATGQELRRFETGSTIQGVAFSPDGRFVLTGNDDKTARLWDAQTGALVRAFTGHTDVVRNVAFSPDGTRIVTASSDATVRIWDVQTGQELRRLIGHKSDVFSVVFAPDGASVLSGSLDTTALRWDVQPQREYPQFTHASAAVAAFSPDGARVLTGSADTTARLWDAQTGVQQWVITGTEFFSSVAFSPDGVYALTGSMDKTARLWDARTGQELRRLVGHRTYLNSVAFSPDGRYILTGSGDREARLWDAQSGQELRQLVGHSFDNIFSVAFSPDSAYALTGSYDGTARLWDVQTGQEIRRFAIPNDGAAAVTFSPDGTQVLTGSWDGITRLWDAQTGQEIRRFVGHTDIIWGVAFSPDGKQILTGSQDKTARLWDVQTGQELRRFSGHRATVQTVAFSPDGRRILTGSGDGTARIWDADYHETISYICRRLLRDFTTDERAQYGIADSEPTCAAQP